MTALVRGSIQDVATRRGLTVAEAFLDAEAVVVVDVSSSMDARDAGGGQARYTVAREQLARLQGEMPGKVAVVAFANDVAFCASGVPTFLGGSTDMAEALRFVHKCDGLMRVVVIGDGEPNDEDGTLREAAKFTNRIDTIFVGDETSRGREFMQRLAAATGGKAVRQDVAELGLLSDAVKGLLTA